LKFVIEFEVVIWVVTTPSVVSFLG